MIPTPPHVYLAGGFYEANRDWKARATERLTMFRIVDPEAFGTQRPADYVSRDLHGVATAALILAVQDAYPYVYGMAAEIGYAAALNVPVIYVCTAPRIDGFLSALARATFTQLDPALDFIVARYGTRAG